jgi:hypothetical protein
MTDDWRLTTNDIVFSSKTPPTSPAAMPAAWYFPTTEDVVEILATGRRCSRSARVVTDWRCDADG